MTAIVRFLVRGFVLLPFLLTACALGDVTTTAPPASLTIAAPPALSFSGSCENTKELENWLQISTGLVANFQTTMNEAAGMNKGDAYAPTLRLIELRDSAFTAVTPDCATDLEQILTDTMNKAVTALQQYVNGDTNDISGAIAEANTQFDQITQSQNELIQRLQGQILGQIQQPTATTP